MSRDTYARRRAHLRERDARRGEGRANELINHVQHAVLVACFVMITGYKVPREIAQNVRCEAKQLDDTSIWGKKKKGDMVFFLSS